MRLSSSLALKLVIFLHVGRFQSGLLGIYKPPMPCKVSVKFANTKSKLWPFTDMSKAAKKLVT